MNEFLRNCYESSGVILATFVVVFLILCVIGLFKDKAIKRERIHAYLVYKLLEYILIVVGKILIYAFVFSLLFSIWYFIGSI